MSMRVCDYCPALKKRRAARWVRLVGSSFRRHVCQAHYELIKLRHVVEQGVIEMLPEYRLPEEREASPRPDRGAERGGNDAGLSAA